MKTILIQGAMPTEVCFLIDYYHPHTKETIAGFDFYIASYKNTKIIISQTQIGIIDATQSTTIGLQKYHSDIVINQGCAGGATLDIKIGDVVVGISAVYINAFNTLVRPKSAGSNALEWLPRTHRPIVVGATKTLIDLAADFFGSKVAYDCLGSGDMFNRETDRINYLHSCFGHVCEDMETAAVYKVCEDFGVDHIALRIISNNELSFTPKDKTTHTKIQEITTKFVDYLISNIC